MPFASALSTAESTAQALSEIGSAGEQLGVPPELAVVFFSAHHADASATIAKVLQQTLNPRGLIGCIGEAIVGTGREIEHAPALSLWLGHWNGRVEIAPFHLAPQQSPDGLSLLGAPDQLVEGSADDATLLVLGDPFTFPAAEVFLPQINR